MAIDISQEQSNSIADYGIFFFFEIAIPLF
jgi:hypothetical protein